jgi:hypothetical protein
MGNQVVYHNGLFYEHWFHGIEVKVRPAEWATEDALIRVWDREGRLVHRFGKVRQYEGEGATHFMNRGEFRIHDDTLWFARKSDARILAFPLAHPSEQPVRVIELPVYYRAAPPTEHVSNENGDVAFRLQSHLRAFDIGPSGDFYLVQSISWPDPAERRSFTPESILTIASADGSVKQRYWIDGIADVAITEDMIVGNIRRDGQIQVRVFQNPLRASSAPVGCDRKEAKTAVAGGGAQ